MTMPLAQPQSDLYPPSNVQVASATPATIVEISSGLLAREAWTSPKYLYDALGSKLFEAICELPEYYPTRTEAAIFARHGAEIAHVAGSGTTLVDLGAGNCAKAAGLCRQDMQLVDVSLISSMLGAALRGRTRAERAVLARRALQLLRPGLAEPAPGE